MTARKIRSLIVVGIIATLTALPIVAQGALVVPNPGSIAPPDVITGGDWLGTNVSLDWNITSVANGYRYTYTFTAPVSPGLSHFDLQISGTFLAGNILAVSPGLDYQIGTFAASDPGNSSPGLPEGQDLYGIKFEGAVFDGSGPWTFWLESDRAPMEGDFYAKGGTSSFAYNSGFGTLTGAHILVPDTHTNRVPEPGTMMLLGTGLVGISILGRKRTRS